jgi:hypothetical protein
MLHIRGLPFNSKDELTDEQREYEWITYFQVCGTVRGTLTKVALQAFPQH